MEREIGEIFEVNGVKLQVVEDFDLSCGCCYFINNDEQCVLSKCFASQRKDGNPVKFIEIGD